MVISGFFKNLIVQAEYYLLPIEFGDPFQPILVAWLTRRFLHRLLWFLFVESFAMNEDILTLQRVVSFINDTLKSGLRLSVDPGLCD